MPWIGWTTAIRPAARGSAAVRSEPVGRDGIVRDDPPRPFRFMHDLSRREPLAVPQIRQRASVVSGSPLGAVAELTLARWAEADVAILVLAPSERRAEMLGAILHAFDPDCGAMVLPRSDVLPYDGIVPSRDIAGRRASVLRRLARGFRGIVIETPDAVLQRVPPPSAWTDAIFALAAGQPLDVAALREFLERAGYDLDARVDDPGEANLQGRVIDVFPAGAIGPVRIEHEDGRILGLSSYDPLTQRSTGDLADIVLEVASEGCVQTNEQTGTSVFDYVPEALVVADARADARASAFLRSVRDSYETRRALPAGLTRDMRPPLPPDLFYLDRAAWEAASRRPGTIVLAEVAPAAEQHVPLFAAGRSPLRQLRAFVGETTRAGRKLVLTTADAHDRRTCESRLRRAGAPAATQVSSWADVLAAPPAAVLSLRADLEAGFVSPSTDTAVIAAADLLGSRARQDAPFGVRVAAVQPETEGLRPGDAVLHLARGLGVLTGIETVATTDAGAIDMIRLRYADDTDVLLPVHELAAVRRHGGDPESLMLDSADGATWSRRSARLRREIDDTAHRMVALAAGGRHGPRRPCGRLRPSTSASPPASRSCRRSIRTPPSGPCSATSRRAARWIGWCAATSASARPRWRCGRPPRPCWPASRWPWWPRRRCWPPSTPRRSAAALRRSASRWGIGRASPGRPRSGSSWPSWRTGRFGWWSAPMRSPERACASPISAWSSSTRSTGSACARRAGCAPWRRACIC
ncbi:transcription-repair coupling factor (superfamily II helicase) [Rhodoplanes tepidamans]|nr:transcription-repair coupling factor (superfamily II helicase) [Rhodoplanes tepidamans]